MHLRCYQLIAAAMLSLAGLIGQAQTPPIFELDDRALGEGSGVTLASIEGIEFWAINDSGNAAELFAVDASGKTRLRVPIAARNTDWEDLAHFEHKGRRWLLIADVGDNRARRKSVRLLWLPEPHSDDEQTPEQLNFRYADGPRDCEAVAVDPLSGQALLLTKRDRPPRLYSLDFLRGETVARFVTEVRNIPPPTAADRAEPYGEYRSQPTALDFSADGTTLLVTTYKDAYLYRRGANQDWAMALGVEPTRVDLPQLPQTEGGMFTADQRSVIVVSEGNPGRWAKAAIPRESAPP